MDDATNTISDIIGAGIVPAALEMLDQLILQAVEAAFHFGFPLDAGAVLIMEVDGLEAGLDDDAERIIAIAKKNGAREVRRANTRGRTAAAVEVPQAGVRRRRPAGAELLHAGRRGAAHQAAAHSPRDPARSAHKYDLRIANVFHAGDGNIHPILLFDERDPDQVKRVLAASHEILDECIALRRQRHRRARHRRREDRLHAQAVHARGPGA